MGFGFLYFDFLVSFLLLDFDELGHGLWSVGYLILGRPTRWNDKS